MMISVRGMNKRQRCVVILVFALDLPSKEDIGIMHDQLFGDIDEEDGLDKALQSLQAMRGKKKKGRQLTHPGNLTDR
jgi:hypothetical protein